MSAEDAVNWYGLGVTVMMGIGGGPMLTIVLVRWMKNFLSS
jgi:hypothetical protein